MKRLPLVLSFLAGPAFAQDASMTVATNDNPELGTFLTDSKGMTLYVFTKDEPGTSNCNDDCASNWPPLTSEDDLTLPEGLSGELTLIQRADGTRQVAYNGTPCTTSLATRLQALPMVRKSVMSGSSRARKSRTRPRTQMT